VVNSAGTVAGVVGVAVAGAILESHERSNEEEGGGGGGGHDDASTSGTSMRNGSFGYNLNCRFFYQDRLRTGQNVRF
jgi:hypothetical protein